MLLVQTTNGKKTTIFLFYTYREYPDVTPPKWFILRRPRSFSFSASHSTAGVYTTAYLANNQPWFMDGEPSEAIENTLDC